MKKLCAIASILLTTTIGVAQNQNVQKETLTTTTTIKDSKGEQKIVKTEEVKEIQKVAIGDEQPGTKNIPQVEAPVDVTKTTKVAVNGDLKALDVKHSTHYKSNGVDYELQSDDLGYSIIIPNNKKRALLRRTSNDNYIYTNRNVISLAHFDKDGNLILETYDQKTDTVKTEKLELVKN